VPPMMASRVRLLGLGKSQKPDPNDARSVAIAALSRSEGIPSAQTARIADRRLSAERTELTTKAPESGVPLGEPVGEPVGCQTAFHKISATIGFSGCDTRNHQIWPAFSGTSGDGPRHPHTTDCFHGMQEVRGSNPLSSTPTNPVMSGVFCVCDPVSLALRPTPEGSNSQV
jgi:hypothetical protein